ncbi:MAG: hypothetical protein ACYC5K_00260 [Saccharofermentanales bacterium]
MKNPDRLRTFFLVLALMMIFGLVTVLSSCIPDIEEDDSAGASSVIGDSQDGSEVYSSADVSSSSGTDISEMYQDILDELDELEDVIDGLDGYTSEDLEVPTP